MAKTEFSPTTKLEDLVRYIDTRLEAVEHLMAEKAQQEVVTYDLQVAHSSVSQCVKCGSLENKVRFHQDRYACVYGTRQDKGNEREHLHYTCQNCRYSWCEKPLDARE